MWYVNTVRFIQRVLGITRKEIYIIMKKKLLSILLCAVMLFAITACGEDGKNATPPSVTKLADYSDLSKVYSGDYKIDDTVILDGFQDLIASAGIAVEWADVTDRNTVQKGDIVNLDYTGYLDGKAFQGGSAKDQLINVDKNCGVDKTTGANSGGFIDGFTAGLVGAKVGETIKYEVKFPDDYQSADLKGKTTTFEFKINKIVKFKEYTPETIDDAFVVKNLSDKFDVKTVDEVMTYVEEELRYQGFIGYVTKNSEVEISDDYIAQRVDDYVDYFELKYCSDQLTLETILQYYYGMTEETFRKELATGMKSQVKAEAIYAAIVEKENLTLDEEALKEYVQSILSPEEGSTEKSFFEDEVDIYKYAGSGDAAVGRKYLMHETAIREFIKDLNKK
jgi:FKBP-type peptidyl-prolyl cis-trans isomerase (trigger factor)